MLCCVLIYCIQRKGRAGSGKGKMACDTAGYKQERYETVGRGQGPGDI